LAVPPGITGRSTAYVQQQKRLHWVSILNGFLGAAKNEPLLTLVRTVYRASVIPTPADETEAG